MGSMEQSRKEIQHVRTLIRAEREADFEQHQRQMKRLAPQQRVEEGFSWYPVEVGKKGYTLGDRAFVIVERTTAERPDQFRAGKTVSLYTRNPAVKQGERSGIIQFVSRGRMKIVLNHSDFPDWLGMGSIGVDLQFDDRTYQEMEKALDKVEGAHGDRLAELRDTIYGHFPAYFSSTPTLTLPELNESQVEAVQDMVASQSLAIVHGPPGTGKTTTVVAAVRELVQREATLLVTAPSNTAVDLLTERIAEAGVGVVRIGNISRVDEEILRHTLEVQLSQHPEAKTIKRVRQQAADARKKAQRYRRRYGAEERHERRALFREAAELSSWANQLEDRLLDQILSAAQVITATLVGSSNKVLQHIKFRTVIIDEAAQALEPAAWIPISRASRVILVGDPFQLPPTVKSDEGRRGGLEVTLIEKCIQRGHPNRLLRTQYRMHEDIMGFSNQQFYGNQLQAAPSVARHRLPLDEEPPVLFIDTAGCGFDEKLHPAYQSRYNPEEFNIILEHLLLLIGHIPPEETLPGIALISPYREQVEQMQRRIAEEGRFAEVPLTINTIDGFQGQERDVVYISLVRSNSKGEIGFLKDYRRMNVALTRARKKLVVVGDSATVGQDPFYKAFLEYCEALGAYQTAWAYMM